jgi:hypothetical protein
MEDQENRLFVRHLRAGYWGLAVFIALGILLESLHAFKAGFYLDVGNETRRLLFRLAHTHGTLLSVINIVYALTIRAYASVKSPLASGCLLVAQLLVPGGFFLGGVWVHGGDPGLGVALVPAGAAALFFAVIIIATRISRSSVQSQ